MATPTTLTVFFGGTSQTVPIPATVAYADFVQSIVHGGGFWFFDSTNLATWIPISAVTKITAA